MKEKIWAALMGLAEKLGTTADNLWAILVQQNDVIIFRYHLALWVFGICLALLIVGLIISYMDDWDCEGIFVIGPILAIPAGFIGVIDIIYLVAELGAYTTALKNPEYNAVAKILSALGGGN